MHNLLASESYKIPFFAADKKGNYKTRRAITENQIIKAANAILKTRVSQKGAAITSPWDMRNLLTTQMSDYKNEVFMCLFLDNRHQVISMEEMFHGTVDGASVYIRPIAQRALELNAAALIVAHNHPSGIPEPSHADEQLTHKLDSSLLLIDIRLLDHFIIGGGDCVSLAERGVL